ncbi:hypothetical protein [Pseudonocardia yuanmonensis]|uniref:hypothetical protein n=1 Tax=Pseudonocardia yuanmonensis TaxID=1095914 RepID=UPI0031E77B19
MSEVAFGGRPGVSVGPVGRAEPVVRWAAAVALGGQGRYAAAAALLEGLVRDPRVPVEIRAHALVTRASHLRQRGGHALADGLDGRALALAAGAPGALPGAGVRSAEVDRRVGPPEARGPSARTGAPGAGRWSTAPADLRGSTGPAPSDGPPGVTSQGVPSPCADLFSAHVDALTGLAADALGQGALTRSARLLSRADVLLAIGVVHTGGRSVPWRPVVRTAWVHSELALARGDLDAASVAAARAVRGAAAAGSLRHLLKSRLLAGVVAAVRAAAGEAGSAEAAAGVVAPTPESALAALDAVAEEAATAGLLPLAWAALLAAADAAGTVVRRAGTASSGSSPDGDPEGSGRGTPGGPGEPRTDAGTGPAGAPWSDDPPGAAARPSDRPFEGPEGHDRRLDRLLRSTIGAPSGPARRRHAAAATLSVVRARSEGTGRRLMGERSPGEERLAVV